MPISILLLDCTPDLEEKLKGQGFDVQSGSAGFIDGGRNLPSQVYEKDVIIYDPPLTKPENGIRRIAGLLSRDETPQFPLGQVVSHLTRGAILLAFIKPLANYQPYINNAYKWIPAMPDIEPTSDMQVKAIPSGIEGFKWLKPILSNQYLKLPVVEKLSHLANMQGLYFNRNNDSLGSLIKYGKGLIILLPDCKSNEQIIMNFLHRVIPEILNSDSGIELIDKFLSPQEELAKKKLEKIEKDILKKEEGRDLARQKLAEANRKKINTIKRDETAILVLNYCDLALQQDDVALFYIYKATEALEKKYKGEKQAKNVLGCNAEWNLIGRLANTSYADVRHAPNPGERIKEWTPEQIKDCFEALGKIISAYIKTLF